MPLFLNIKNFPLSLVTPLAYDYRYAFEAIRAYYPIADEIILGLDKDRISWSGEPFDFGTEEVRAFIKNMDTRGIVRLVEGDFHSAGTPMQNDTTERNFLSAQCAARNWVVQIDSDEIMLNAPEFKDWLTSRRLAGNVLGRWVNVFKAVPNGYLVIAKEESWISVATLRHGQYTGCRDTRERKRKSPLRMLHFSWGRSGEELRQKLKNWSHSRDFDTDKFFESWKTLDENNYTQWKNFHPLDGPDWPALKLVSKSDIVNGENRGPRAEGRRPNSGGIS